MLARLINKKREPLQEIESAHCQYHFLRGQSFTQLLDNRDELKAAVKESELSQNGWAPDSERLYLAAVENEINRRMPITP